MISILFNRRTLVLFCFLVIAYVITSFFVNLINNKQSRNKIILKDPNPLLIKNAEIVFRDYVLYEVKRNETQILGLITGSDSLKIQERIKKNFIVDNIRNLKDTSYSIPNNLGWGDKFGVFDFDSLRVTLSINQQKLEEILKEKSEGNDNLIRLGDYVNTDYRKITEFKVERFLFSLLISYILSLLLNYYITRSERKGRKKEYADDSKNIIRKAILKEVIEKLEGAGVESVKIDKEASLTINYDIKESKNSYIENILLNDIKKTELKVEELYDRSSLFLAGAFVVSVLGVVLFFLMVPKFSRGLSVNEYFSFTIRPVLILIFLQTTAFYILKQYKNSINDYKFFYTLYESKKRLLIASQMLAIKDMDDYDKLLFAEILNSKPLIKTNDSGDDEKDDGRLMADVYEDIIKKFKELGR